MIAKNRMVLVGLVAVVAIAAYWFLLLSPKQEEAAALSGQVAAKQAELDTSTREVATYELARAAYKTNYATLARLGKAVPEDDDVRSLMVQIDTAAKRSGVDFQKIDVGQGASTGAAGAAGGPTLPPGAVLNAGGFGEMPFSFSFNGSFFRLSDFFRRLERFVSVSNEQLAVTGRLMGVQTIQLQPDPTKGFPAINAEIGATSYIVPPAEAPAAAAGSATPQAPGSPAGTAPASPGTPPATPATVTGAIR